MTDRAGERAAFIERVSLQLRARYRAVAVDVDPARFALRIHGEGIDTLLPLAPLHGAVLREPARAPALISQFVAAVEQQLMPRMSTTVHPARLLWCVRSRRYLRGLRRAGDLHTAELAGDLVAFVAEELPGSVMRGVPREEWEAAGLDEAALRQVAAANTERRFAGLAQRVAAAERVPVDGWRMSADTLFQSSVLMAPQLLRAFVERVGGEVLLGVPDRGVALATAATTAATRGFAQRVTREFREGMNPVSPVVI